MSGEDSPKNINDSTRNLTVIKSSNIEKARRKSKIEEKKDKDKEESE